MLTYALSPSPPDGLTFDADGRTIAGTPTVVTAETSYTYTATDEDGDTATLTFTITVIEADKKPVFVDAIGDQRYVQNIAISTLTLPAATGGDGVLTYALSPDLPDGLTFDASGRTITGTPTVVMSETGYTYTATDEDGDAATLTFTITVVATDEGSGGGTEADKRPVFGETIGNQIYVQNTAIPTLTLPLATGGDGTLTYALSPSPPAGLAFDASGRTISGTPTVVMPETSYTYTATDEDGDVATLTFTITVIADLRPVFGETIDDQIYLQNSAIATLTLPTATGGDGVLTYALSPTPPDGLTFDADDRTVTGTPTTVSEEVTYTYTATDADGDSATLTFTITVIEDLQPVFVDAIDDQIYLQNSAIAILTLPIATGGDGVLTYALSPSPPDGLTFDADARTITGTPSVVMAETTYTYTATDEDGDVATLTFTITVIEDLQPVFDQAIDDQIYLQNSAIATLTLPIGTGGDGVLTYALSPSPPDGLTFDADTRTITGTPSVVMAETGYTYTATDEDGDSATLTFTITVIEDLQPVFDQAIDDQIYLQNSAIATLTLPLATSGDGVLTYVLSPSPPPDGLTFDADRRTLTGTPTTPSEAMPCIYTATDEDGDTATLTFTIAVIEDLQPVFVDAIDDQSYVKDTEIATLTLPLATGGNGVLTYALGPSPPDGLTYDPETRTVTGTPTTVSEETTYTYTATDEDGDTATLTFTISVSEMALDDLTVRKACWSRHLRPRQRHTRSQLAMRLKISL